MDEKLSKKAPVTPFEKSKGAIENRELSEKLIETFFELADFCIYEGKIDYAIALYEHILAHNPDSEKAKEAIEELRFL